MRKTIIKNKWRKVDPVTGEVFVCNVAWHHDVHNGETSMPYVEISGYNPFPFFPRPVGGKLYSSLHVFNEWMRNNGWMPDCKTTNIIEKVIVYEPREGVKYVR